MTPIKRLCKRYYIRVAEVPQSRTQRLNKEYGLDARQYKQITQTSVGVFENEDFLKDLKEIRWKVFYKDKVPRYFYTVRRPHKTPLSDDAVEETCPLRLPEGRMTGVSPGAFNSELYEVSYDIPIPEGGPGTGKGKLRKTVEKLKVGGSLVCEKKKYNQLYPMSTRLNIKLRVRSINEKQIRVWRIK